MGLGHARQKCGESAVFGRNLLCSRALAARALLIAIIYVVECSLALLDRPGRWLWTSWTLEPTRAGHATWYISSHRRNHNQCSGQVDGQSRHQQIFHGAPAAEVWGLTRADRVSSLPVWKPFLLAFRRDAAGGLTGVPQAYINFNQANQ